MKNLMLYKSPYIFILVSYFLVPIFHDVLPYATVFRSSDWIALLAIYFAGFLAATPLIYFVVKNEPREPKNKLGWSFRVCGCFIAEMILLVVVWDKGAVVYPLLAVYIITTFIFVRVKRNDLLFGITILKDKNTGRMYRIIDGKKNLMSENDVIDISKQGHSFKIREFDSVGINTGITGVGHHSFTDTNFNKTDNHFPDLYVNPTSGLPMNGGMSGLDVAGNSWGTNFNDPANHSAYDPNRGY